VSTKPQTSWWNFCWHEGYGLCINLGGAPAPDSEIKIQFILDVTLETRIIMVGEPVIVFMARPVLASPQ
jgi:hypothetical protein